MKHSDRSNFSVNQVMMSLSAIAYTPFRSFRALQDNLNNAEALEQAYTVFWWAKEYDTIAYLVKNKLTGNYVLVFRGPVFKPRLSFLFNLYEDLILNRQVHLPFGEMGKAKVAAGILKTVQNISQSTCSVKTLQETLTALPENTKVYITGHSLGGSLAAAYAAKLASDNAAGLEIIPYTFGAPATGNDSFANLFDTNNVNSLFRHTSRCVNAHDIIPFLWNDLQGMISVGYGNERSITDLGLCIECMERLLIVARVFYAQPPIQLELKGDIGHDDGFFREALLQHQPNRYLALLGLDPIDNANFYRDERTESLLADSL